MDTIHNNWQKFLLKEEIEKYIEAGEIELFRFSGRDMDVIPLDPEKFRSARMSYSKNDYNVSSFPR